MVRRVGLPVSSNEVTVKSLSGTLPRGLESWRGREESGRERERERESDKEIEREMKERKVACVCV